MKVLVVEDDPQIQKSLSLGLTFGGYDVVTADTIEQGRQKLNNSHFDLLLFDVGLPDGSGIDLCKEIRAAGQTTPVLFLSARTDEETVVNGIISGADDYVRKPFGMEELKARMNKALKNSRQPPGIIIAGPLKLDLNKRFATVANQPLQLGRREFDILTVLARHPGDVVTRDQILRHLDENGEVYDRTIDSHMSHLRKKVRTASGDGLQIIAVYGVGYRLQWREV